MRYSNCYSSSTSSKPQVQPAPYAESMVHYYNHALSSTVPGLRCPSDLLSHPPVAILTSREPSKPLPLCLHETTEVTVGRQSHWVVSPHTYSQNQQPGSWHCPGTSCVSLLGLLSQEHIILYISYFTKHVSLAPLTLGDVAAFFRGKPKPLAGNSCQLPATKRTHSLECRGRVQGWGIRSLGSDPGSLI